MLRDAQRNAHNPIPLNLGGILSVPCLNWKHLLASLREFRSKFGSLGYKSRDTKWSTGYT